jgi:glutathione S-transferase
MACSNPEQPEGMAMIVFGSTLSPYVRKVMVFGAEKGVALELRTVAPGASDPAFRAASPFGKMPALQDGDFSIADSSAIVAYLEAKHPEPALIPAEPQARARTIWYDELADTLVMAASAPIFGNRFVLPRVLKRPGDHDAADRAEREQLPPLFEHLEGAIPDSGFLVGDALTLADIAVASPFATLGCIDVAPCPKRFPRLCGYLAAIHARPSFAEILRRDRATVSAFGGAAPRAA